MEPHTFHTFIYILMLGYPRVLCYHIKLHITHGAAEGDSEINQRECVSVSEIQVKSLGAITRKYSFS